MNQHTLFIEMNPAPEALERVLRVTRHRGFTIKNMNMNFDGIRAQMAITLNSERPIGLLIPQLNKLFDVTICRLQQDQSQETHLVANA